VTSDVVPSRPGTQADLAALQSMLSTRLAADWPVVRMHPGDLDWWAVHAWGRGPDQPGLPERLRVWTDASTQAHRPDILAFAWYVPEGDVDIVLDPALATGDRGPGILRQALAWGAAQRDRYATDPGAPILAWAAMGSLEASLLEALGRLPRTEGRAFLQLTGPAEIAEVDPLDPPAGLTVRGLANADVESRVVCGRAAFRGSTMTPDRYRRTFLARLYRAELDRIVVDGDGRVVAFALGWFDPSTRVAELEPVGVHPDHHRQGLGTLVCRAVIRAARELGASRVVISAERDNAAAVGLYRSLGLTVTSTVVPFTEPAPAAASVLR
jgi:ribosomal protein S18 acetylase RimI-like enzyme